jgi:membrane protein DedA with SNARE-associated domain
MDWWHRLSSAAWRFLDEHGQLSVFLFLLVEEAGTPVPIPGDFLMVLAGVRAAQGRLNLLEVLVVMQVATVLGACILYWISARAGRRVVYRLGKHVGLTAERLDRAADELNRRGAAAVIAGRLTPGLRMATPVICGVFHFPFRVYLPAVTLGAFLYLLAYTLLGYFFGPRVLHVLETFELPFALLTSGCVLAGLLFWTVRVGRRATPPEHIPRLAERLRAGAASGLIATLISALLANVLIHLFGLMAFSAPGTALGQFFVLLSADIRRTPGVAAALLLLPAALLVGVGLGAVYAAWLGKASHGGPLRGAAFALIPLTVSLLVVLPLVGAGPAGLALDAGPVPAAGETIRHLTFGLVLGTLYPAMARPRQRRPGELKPDTSAVEPAAVQPATTG